MPTVSTSIEIAAPPAAVWEVFSDFDRYPEWNPFMIKMTGEQKGLMISESTSEQIADAVSQWVPQ